MRKIHFGGCHPNKEGTKLFARLALALVVVVGASARPAIAGSWKFHMTSGSVTHLANGLNFGPIWRMSADSNNSMTVQGTSASVGGGPSHPSTASATLSATVTGTWVPNPALPSDPPPSNQSVKIVAQASANGMSGPATSVASADNGLGNAAVTSPQNNGSLSVVSQGTKLQQINGTSFTVSLSLSASCIDNGTPTANSMATVGISSVVLSIDNRSVKIGYAPTYGQYPQLNNDGSQVIDSNGDPCYVAQVNTPGHGDTLRSYMSYTYDTGSDVHSSQEIDNIQTYSANYSGPWSTQTVSNGRNQTWTIPNTTWLWVPTNTRDDAWNYGVWYVDMASQFHVMNGENVGADPRGQQTVKYTATDNVDGATASDSYLVYMHDPLEHNYPDHTKTAPENMRKAPFAPAFVNSSQVPTDITVYAESGFSVTVEPHFDAIGKWLAECTGIDVHASFTYTYNAGGQILAKDVPPGYATCLGLVDVYTTHWGKVDTWAANGYTGTQPYNFKVPDPNGAYYTAYTPWKAF